MVCGPSDVVFKKPAILSFQHCAALKQGQMSLSVFYSDSAPEDSPNWQVLLNRHDDNLNVCPSPNRLQFPFLEIGYAGSRDDQHSRIQSGGPSPMPSGSRPAGTLRFSRRIRSTRWGIESGYQNIAPRRLCSTICRPECWIRISAPMLRAGRHDRRIGCSYLSREESGWTITG